MTRDPDPEAARLVAALDDLISGERAIGALVALGPRAIPALRDYLLHGRPSTVYQPRRWAVNALGGLRATDALIEYLSTPRDLDPQVRFAEEAVQNAAVRELAAHPTATIADFLLDLSKTKMLPALAEAFGDLRVTGALPFLDRALEDDVCRPPAEEALRKLGPAARRHLVMSAVTPQPSAGDETPSSLRRRRSALWALADIGIAPEDWDVLRLLAREEDPEAFAALCTVACNAGVPADRGQLVRRLVDLVPASPWHLRDAIERCLTAWFEEAEPVIQAEVMWRAEAQRLHAAFDETLRFLSRVLRHGRRD